MNPPTFIGLILAIVVGLGTGKLYRFYTQTPTDRHIKAIETVMECRERLSKYKELDEINLCGPIPSYSDFVKK
jgi:hypothetical protein